MVYMVTLPRHMNQAHIEVLMRMYYYDAIAYRDYRHWAMKFLGQYFPELHEDTLVAAPSMHNAGGKSWSILLIQGVGRTDWLLVGQFGHNLIPPKGVWRPNWLPYLSLSFLGIVPGHWPSPAGHSNQIAPIRLGNLEAYNRWLDNFDPTDHFFGRDKPVSRLIPA